MKERYGNISRDNMNMRSYLLVNSGTIPASIEVMYDELRKIFSALDMSKNIVVFPGSAEVFNFIKDTSDNDLRELFRDFYHQKLFISSSEITTKPPQKMAGKNIVVTDHFSTPIECLNRLVDSQCSKLTGFVMNHNIEGDTYFVPYGEMVSRMVLDNASDEHILIYLSLKFNLTNHDAIQAHINNIKKHLQEFTRCEFIQCHGSFLSISGNI